jgi:hypothetical protein
MLQPGERFVRIDAQETFNLREERILYGRVFESMYTGSMMGSGAMMFAVWGYVLTHQQGNRERTHFTVELNSKLIAVLIGESEAEIDETIERFCQPDPHSRSQVQEGRKLLKLGTYLYEVVNGTYYDKLKRECEKREADRVRQAKFREQKVLRKAGRTSKQSDNGGEALLPVSNLVEEMRKAVDEPPNPVPP